MKKIYFLLLFLLISFSSKGEAFYDIFIVYGKHNNTIKKIILEALNSSGEKWQRGADPVPKSYGSTSTYMLDGKTIKESERLFTFEELNYTKDPKADTPGKLLALLKKNCPKLLTFQVIFEKENEFCIEKYDARKEKVKNHDLYWIVHLGNGKYRNYFFTDRENLISEEKKDSLLKIFQYMEDRIKNVP